MGEFGEYLKPKDLAHPSGSEIIQELLVTGDAFTSDFDILKAHLDRIAPVRVWFKVLSLPPGPAPDEIRQEWVGLTLPIRGPRNEGIAIITREALEKLRHKSPKAHDWWEKYYAQESATRAPGVDSKDFPEFHANITYIVLADACGESRIEE
jgi:hypothetical protein